MTPRRKCPQCENNGLTVWMVRKGKEIIFEDNFDIWYKYTFECSSCGETKTVYGQPCGFCSGMGYHCHVHSGTTCNHCRGSGVYAVPESYIEFLRTRKQPKECENQNV